MGREIEVINLEKRLIGDCIETDKAIVPTRLVKAMLGGEWPEARGFCFDAVDHFRCEDGRLVPYDGFDPAPGPDFELVMIPFL